MRRFFLLFAFILLGCHDATTASAPAVCRVTPVITPPTATILVGSAITFTSSLEGGCPVALFRNETPAILQLDSVFAASLRVRGISAGLGRFRIRAGAETTLSTVVSVTVAALLTP